MIDTFVPLLDFIERLSGDHLITSTNKLQIKSTVAREMYGCNGWIAHGYVDSVMMNPGLMGAAQWYMII